MARQISSTLKGGVVKRVRVAREKIAPLTPYFDYFTIVIIMKLVFVLSFASRNSFGNVLKISQVLGVVDYYLFLFVKNDGDVKDNIKSD